MIQLFWGLLNIAILICFIIICFKSTRIIKEKLGIFAALFFAFGLLSFVKPNDGETNPKIFDLQNPEFGAGTFEGNSHFVDLTLEEGWANEINLGIKYGVNETSKKMLQAHSGRNGFVSGTNWSVTTITVVQSDNSKSCDYRVSGILEWKILSFTIYSQPKNFEGTVALKY